MRGGYADPSLIITAELAFNRLALEKGQWTALGQIVTKDAVLFQPGPVFAERWLKGRRNPTVPLRWQTRQVFMACDGSGGISTGTWVRSGESDSSSVGRHGWFTNIWRRDKGKYRLILSHDGPLTAAQVVRDDDDLEAMTARTASCAVRAVRSAGAGIAPQGPRSGQAAAALPIHPRQALPMSRDDSTADGSLRWRWSVGADGAHVLEAWMATDDGEALILTDRSGPVLP